MRRGWKRRCKRSINPIRLQSRLWQKRKRAIRLRATTMRTHRTRPCLPTISRAISCWTLSRQMPQKSRP
nr:MAG TPA: hypothetical protein [Caudoviricetes sp.]